MIEKVKGFAAIGMIGARTQVSKNTPYFQQIVEIPRR